MFAPAATAARTANRPEWNQVPSPMFAKTCAVPECSAMPSQVTPSPPIWLMVSVRRSMPTAIRWQPTPASAHEPSGTRVDWLCGQPEQKYGVRCSTSAARAADASCSRNIARCSRTAWLSWNGAMRAAITRATSAGDSSPVGGNSHWCGGAGHSPLSSNLPTTRGRSPSGQSYSISFNWYSMTWRFSSTTRISRSPRANRRTPPASSGHGMPTWYRRRPMSAATRSSIPRLASAWRTSSHALPQAMIPRRGRGVSNTSRFSPLARA